MDHFFAFAVGGATVGKRDNTADDQDNSDFRPTTRASAADKVSMKILRLFIALALCPLFTTFAMADKNIAVSELPSKAAAAIQAKFKDATLLSAERETKNGAVVYEVKIRVGEKEKEVHVTEGGEILRVENED